MIKKILLLGMLLALVGVGVAFLLINALLTVARGGALFTEQNLLYGALVFFGAATAMYLGFAVTGIDFAPSAVAHVRRNLSRQELRAEVLEADVLGWQPEAPFDAVYEQTCLCALPEEAWPDYAARLYGWLRPAGSLFALFMQTGQPGGPPRHCDLLRMRRIFDEDRWHWPESEPMLVPHRNGRFELGYVLKRR